MKTKEELNALRQEVENLGKKLAELTEEELSQVAGGCTFKNNETVMQGGAIALYEKITGTVLNIAVEEVRLDVTDNVTKEMGIKAEKTNQ